MGNRTPLLIVTVLLSLHLFLPTAFAAVEEGFGILYGVDHSFGFNAPKGWVLDNKVAVSQGLHAVFYPKGQTWGKSPVIIYARARSKDSVLVTVDRIVNDTLNDFRKDSPEIKATPSGVISLPDGKQGRIYHYTGDRWGNFEAAAYFEEKKTINFFVLSARNEKAFKQALPAFEQLTKSYMYMGDAPQVEQKKEVSIKGPPELFEITTACDSKRLCAIEDALGDGEEYLMDYDYSLNLMFEKNALTEISLTGSQLPEEVQNCIIDRFKKTAKFTAPAKGIVPIEVSFPVMVTPKASGSS